MKRLLLIAFLFVGAWVNKAFTQCNITVSNVKVEAVGFPLPAGAGKCEYTFNLQFDLSYNNGATYVYLTSYLAADYTALNANPATALAFECANSNTPARDVPVANRLGTAVDQLGKSFMDIGLDLSSVVPGNGVVVPMIGTYSQDATVALIQNSNPAGPGYQAGVVVTKDDVSGTTDRFTVKNVKVIVNQACGAAIDVRTDVYASNANSANAKAQCYICGIPQLFNDPVINGFKNCNNPRQFSVGIVTLSATPIVVSYIVYVDNNSNGILDAGDTEGYNSITASENILISNVAPYASGLKTYTGANVQPTSEKPLIVVVSGPALPNSISRAFEHPGCIPLPVKLASFTAKRKSASSVELQWRTATEQNNKGFYIQRKNNGNWENLALVFSAAQDGNSSVALNYSYRDNNNNSKGVSQYRLQQVDLDGSVGYSDVRTVKGEGARLNIQIYPNPSQNGTASIVFDAAANREVVVLDATGRTVRQERTTSMTMRIDNLADGFYSIRITDRNTGEVSVEKLMVRKK